jgi:phage terminase small subunit
MAKEDLTPKQEKFCQEMSKLGNQYQAYCNSFNTKGMKRETIDKRACELMKNGKITGRLKALAEETKSKNTAEAQEIQEYLTQVIRGQINEDCIVVESIGDYQSRARNVKKQVTPKDRIKACETLAKMRGYFDLTIKIDNAPTIIDDIK